MAVRSERPRRRRKSEDRARAGEEVVRDTGEGGYAVGSSENLERYDEE